MFARRPVRSRAPRILAVAVACGLAPIGCERTPTGSSGPSGAIADPTLLPLASGQAPSPAAYDALLVANQPAGFSYNDPVTNVKIWKVDRKSTRLNSSHLVISYAVFCLKKKKRNQNNLT